MTFDCNLLFPPSCSLNAQRIYRRKKDDGLLLGTCSAHSTLKKKKKKGQPVDNRSISFHPPPRGEDGWCRDWGDVTSSTVSVVQHSAFLFLFAHPIERERKREKKKGKLGSVVEAIHPSLDGRRSTSPEEQIVISENLYYISHTQKRRRRRNDGDGHASNYSV